MLTWHAQAVYTRAPLVFRLDCIERALKQAVAGPAVQQYAIHSVHRPRWHDSPRSFLLRCGLLHAWPSTRRHPRQAQQNSLSWPERGIKRSAALSFSSIAAAMAFKRRLAAHLDPRSFLRRGFYRASLTWRPIPRLHLSLRILYAYLCTRAFLRRPRFRHLPGLGLGALRACRNTGL